METSTETIKRLYGYYALPRGRFLLLRDEILTKEEFLLYDASLAIADWDKKNHPATYGLLLLNQREIESLLGLSVGYVSRYGKKLIEKGFWLPEKKGIRVIGFEMIEQKLLSKITKEVGIVDIQKQLAILQKPIAEVQKEVAELQELQPKDKGEFQGQEIADLQTPVTKSDVISYKDESKFSIRNNEEYQSIKLRVDKLGELIGENWLSTDPRIQKLVQEHQRLAGKMLEYETENDLLPI